MSIRSNALPVGRDLAPELQEILRKNGMQAHIIRQGEGYQLAVQGHDSPLLTYAITAQQHRALVDWGANSANKQAYNTVAELVKNDFYMPRDFVHARNANGRVAMGLHGYRIGVGEYGRLPWNKRHVHMMMDPYHGRFLGWTPRCQEGFHMRRVGGAMFMQGAPIVPERPDGRMKPGELQNGYILTIVGDDEEQSIGIDLNSNTGIRFAAGNELVWKREAKRDWDKFNFGIFGCWAMDEDGNLDYIPEENYTEEMWNEQKKLGMRMMQR